MVTNSIIKLFHGYPFSKKGKLYLCTFTCDFSTSEVKTLLVHMEKCHANDFKQLVEIQKESVKILNEAVNDLSDTDDDDKKNSHLQQTTYLMDPHNTISQIHTNTASRIFHHSYMENDRSTLQNKDDQLKYAVRQLYLDLDQGKINFDQFAVAIQELHATFSK